MGVRFTRLGLAYFIGRALGKAASGDSLYLHLLQGAVPQSGEATWDNVQEVAYTGYAPVEVPPADATIGSSTPGWTAISAPSTVWRPTDAAVPTVATGVAWTFDDEGTNGPQLLATEVFPSGKPLDIPGASITAVHVLALNEASMNGPGSAIV